MLDSESQATRATVTQLVVGVFESGAVNVTAAVANCVSFRSDAPTLTHLASLLRRVDVLRHRHSSRTRQFASAVK